MTAVAASDVDVDGDLDAVIAFGSDGIHWAENLDGAGSFGELQLVTYAPLELTHIAVGDLDGDGDDDIVTADIQDGDLNWYRNKNADNDFSSKRTIIEHTNWTVRYTDVELVDVDGDGDLDIVAVGNAGMFWFRNANGRGTFDAPIAIDEDVSYDGTLDVGDIDSDGDLDIVLAASGGQVKWYPYHDGAFGTGLLLGDNYRDGEVELADLDDDGDMDVVLGFTYNQTSGDFSTRPGLVRKRGHIWAADVSQPANDQYERARAQVPDPFACLFGDDR